MLQIILEDETNGAIFAETHNMLLSVVLPVHPLSLKVLSAHHGASPIFLNNHDPLFDLFTGSRCRRSSGPIRDRFTADLTFVVSEDIARHIQANSATISDRLFRYHKEMLCWYVTAMVHAKGKGCARPAINQWMTLHGISEDDYSTESFYKVWQRFGWEFSKKNPQFSEQMRARKGGVLLEKKRRLAKNIQPIERLKIRQQDVEVELAISRFLTSYQNCFRRIPVKLPKHTRLYMYKEMQGLTEREVAVKCNASPGAAHHAMQAMRNRIQKSITVRTLLEESIALPA